MKGASRTFLQCVLSCTLMQALKGRRSGPAPSVVGDLIVCGKKPLHLPRRLETLHDPLSSSCRLVGVFRPVVEAFVLAMLDAGHDLPLGRGIAAQLVGDQHPRRSPLLLQKLAQQAFGSLLVAPALHEDIENKALLVDRAPEPVLRASGGDDDLIEVPFVAPAWGSLADAICEFLAEFQSPLPDRLVCDRDAPSRQYLLHHAKAQWEPEIQPNRVTDELSGVAVASKKRISGRRHLGQIPDHQGAGQPGCPQLDGAPAR